MPWRAPVARPGVVRRWKSAGKVRSAPARCPVGDESEAGLTPSVEQFVPTRTCVSDGSCHVPDGRIRPHRTLYLPVERQYSHEQRLYRRAEEAPHAVRAGPQPVPVQGRADRPGQGRGQAQPLVVQLAKLARAGAVRRRKREALGSGHRSRAQGRPGRRLRQDRSQAQELRRRRRHHPVLRRPGRGPQPAREFALYADNFPVWSEQAGGMAQLSVWAALANAGVGASLQHYNPLVDADVAREWNIPASWSCARRCRSARTKPASAKRPSWTTPSVSAWPAKQAGACSPLAWPETRARLYEDGAGFVLGAVPGAADRAARMGNRKAGAVRTTDWRDRPARTPAGPVPA